MKIRVTNNYYHDVQYANTITVTKDNETVYAHTFMYDEMNVVYDMVELIQIIANVEEVKIVRADED